MSAPINYIPCDWLRRLGRDQRLSKTNVRLALLIARSVNAFDGVARLSHPDLARLAGSSERVAIRSRDRLTALGYISYEPGHGNTLSQYWLRLPDSPDAPDIRVDPLELYVANHAGGVQ
jgi:hypothetical protein